MSYSHVADKLDRGQPVVLDGAIGTEILHREASWADHQLKRRPDLVRAIHADYLEAGADVIPTNTFQLSRRGFSQHFKDAEHMRHIGAPDLDARWAQLIRAAVQLAQEARAQAGMTERVAVAG